MDKEMTEVIVDENTSSDGKEGTLEKGLEPKEGCVGWYSVCVSFICF
jgi:hypothetical protein